MGSATLTALLLIWSEAGLLFNGIQRLVPDSRCCYFHKHVGEQAVRAVADAAILKYQSAEKETKN